MGIDSKNIFAELFLSCFSIKSYRSIIHNGFFKRTGYHLLTTVILFLISVVLPYSVFEAGIGGLQTAMEEVIPDFQIADGELYVSEPLFIEDEGLLFDIDTEKYFIFDGGVFYQYNYDIDDYEEYVIVTPVDQVLLADREKIMVYNKGEYNEAYFSDFSESFDGINRDSVINFVKGFIPVMGGIIFIFMFIVIMWNAFVSTIIALIQNNSIGGRASFMELYNIGLYARTPANIIKAVLSVAGMTVGIKIPFMWLIYILGTAVYTFYILKDIKKYEDDLLLSTKSHVPPVSIGYGGKLENDDYDSAIFNTPKDKEL